VTLNQTYHRWVVGLIVGLFIIRLCGLFISPLGLHGDEAQYWSWSKDLDWGYFTKPPMIAWVIATTTSLFGDAEWAVRLSSPLLHSLTAYMIFRTARFIYDAKTGLWAAAIYLLMPAVWLSSGIVSTDVPLLLCWIIALNAWAHLRDDPAWRWIVQLGVAVGLGLLSKYAMLFFFPPIILAILFDKPTRRGLLNLKGCVAAILILVCVTPNILWNMQNDFATFDHTAANANLDAKALFHPGELLSFWGEQFGVFGPLTLIFLFLALIATFRRKLQTPTFWLSLFVLSPLVIISLEALLSRANANWAVTAYVAASILVAHLGVHYGKRWFSWLKASVVVQGLIGFVLTVILLVPAWTDQVGAANAVKRVRAWPETVSAIQKVYSQGHDGQDFSAMGFDKRIVFYSLKYYGLGETAPIKMWQLKSHPQNQADLTEALSATDGPILLVNYSHPDVKPGREDYTPYFREDFERVEKLPMLDIDLGGGKRRRLNLWAAYGYTPTTTR